MDARRSPQRIVNTHPLDQRAQIRVDLRSTSKRAGFPTPVPTEAGPMPTHEGLGPNDRDGLQDRWKPSIQLDQEQAIAVREVDTTTHLAPQHSWCRSAAFSASSRLFDLNGKANRVRKKQSSAIIAVEVRRFDIT
jgi:hypothetical protein